MRLIFAFCIAMKLNLITLDFNQVFIQADIKNDVFIEISAEYNNINGNYILKLKTNFYRLIDTNLI